MHVCMCVCVCVCVLLKREEMCQEVVVKNKKNNRKTLSEEEGDSYMENKNVSVQDLGGCS